MYMLQDDVCFVDGDCASDVVDECDADEVSVGDVGEVKDVGDLDDVWSRDEVKS